MAGIIDIRFNYKQHIWTAKPRFSYDRDSFMNGAPSAEGCNYLDALYNLCALLPEDMANKIRIYSPRRIYRSPEYIWMNDKCIEVDGHCPNRIEWARRRSDFLREQKMENI